MADAPRQACYRISQGDLSILLKNNVHPVSLPSSPIFEYFTKTSVLRHSQNDDSTGGKGAYQGPSEKGATSHADHRNKQNNSTQRRRDDPPAERRESAAVKTAGAKTLIRAEVSAHFSSLQHLTWTGYPRRQNSQSGGRHRAEGLSRCAGLGSVSSAEATWDSQTDLAQTRQARRSLRSQGRPASHQQQKCTSPYVSQRDKSDRARRPDQCGLTTERSQHLTREWSPEGLQSAKDFSLGGSADRKSEQWKEKLKNPLKSALSFGDVRSALLASKLICPSVKQSSANRTVYLDQGDMARLDDGAALRVLHTTHAM